MKKRVLFRWLLSLLLVALMAAACGSTESESPPPRSTELPTQPPTMEAAPTPEARGACGDGICNGPETAQNCPQDCAPVAQPTEGAAPPPEASEAPPETGSSACLTPNPRRAVVSEELTEWRNWLSDGGFEAGATDVILEDLGSFQQATAERSPAAARSGSYGYAITAGPGEGITFSLRVNMEKGETTRFSFWARSPGGQVALQPTVWAFAAGQEPHELYSSPAPISVGPEWTEVSFPVENDRGLLYALLSLQVGPNTTLHIDDAQVEFPQFKMAEYEGSSRTVGGVPVPVEPLAPTHISFLIHMEDPPQIQTVEEYFQTKTAVFRELARMFHEHGGFLTIQPEEDWVKGAQQFAPDTLRQLVEDYDVIYSTHTHGPHCRDAEGRLRSLTDCNNAPVGEAWDQSVEDYTYPEVIEYVRALRDLISDASGTTVTDHNGNWEFAQASRFAEIPMLTWSAYKNHRDQRTYDVLINNPWRPTEASPDANTEAFLTHDPDTQIVYIPGWSQAITRHPERVPDRMPPLISQFIRFADPDRVNSFYVVMHIDHFYSRAGDPDYIVYDQDTGEFSYSAEFRQHIQYYDDMLTELIDPLAAEGYLQWTSLPEIGELYLEWERNCGLPAEQAPDETPAAPPAQGRCGDGACAGPENTQNCPQDCGGSPAPSPTTTQGTAALPSTGSPNYEPPINIFLVLHIDPGQTTDEDPTFQATPTIYERTHEEIDWLVEETARHNLHFTSLYNGWYPKWALENDDLNQFQALLDAGHVIGTHAHRLTYDPETDLWTARVHELSSYGRPDYDHDLARQAWDDADRYVDAVLAELGVTGQNEIMASLAFKCSTQGGSARGVRLSVLLRQPRRKRRQLLRPCRLESLASSGQRSARTRARRGPEQQLYRRRSPGAGRYHGRSPRNGPDCSADEAAVPHALSRVA